MDHQRVALQMLNENKLFSKYIKCEFWLRLVVLLCVIICSEGVKVDRRKKQAVMNWPRPQSPIDIRSFLGLAGYNRRFMDGFASIASPLTTLTQKSIKFEWSEACERRFQISKYRLTFVPMLNLPEGTHGFVVYCDVSRVGLPCVLIQKGQWKPMPLDHLR